ncbi:cytochrome P450 2M1-like [Lepisosteus oculatus]|uniref:cytochrome P450 2M1-like n=1 Tax=Lepisosteus oculatus TaxID=7918 RepID=UPI0037226807
MWSSALWRQFKLRPALPPVPAISTQCSAEVSLQLKRMELFSFLGSNILTLLLSLLFLALLWRSRSKQSQPSRLPPGPAPWPFVGSLLHVDLKQPYKSYLKLSQQYGPVFTVWLGSKPVVVLSGYRTLRDAFVSQGEEFSGRANYPILQKVTDGYGLLVSSGDRWKELRRFSIMTLKNFGMGRRSIEERIQEEAKCLVDAFAEHGDSAFNPKFLLCNAVSNVVCSIVFGKRFDYHDSQFKSLLNVIDNYFTFLSSSRGQLYNMFPRVFERLPGPHHLALGGVRRLRELIREEALRRLGDLNADEPRDYIEAFLVKMQEEKHNPNSTFNYDNLTSSVWNLFSAGTETTSSTLRHTLLLMQKYPNVQARIQKEIDEVIGPLRSPTAQDRQNMPYTDAVVHEIQRSLDLSPTAVPHKVLKDTEFKGYTIPQGTMVIPLLSSVLSDPELWKHPDTFDPENFLDEKGSFKKNDAFLAFGLGKRVCLGEGLARMELFLFFTSLLQKFTFTGTEPPEQIETNPQYCSFGRMPRTYQCYARLRA